MISRAVITHQSWVAGSECFKRGRFLFLLDANAELEPRMGTPI